MKNFIYISILALGFSCTESSVPTPERPAGLPENLPYHWGTYEQQAWEDGRLTYNEDTTMCIIISERDWAITLKGMPAAYQDSVKRELLDR
jgi:hypothetical protein